MGTRGFYVFKYKGIYYIYYQHFDSYPQGGLGKQIVDEVKKLTLEDIEKIKSLLLNIKLTEEENEGNISKFKNIFHSIENYNDYVYYTSKKEPEMGEYDTEYIYIINFDLNIIKMKSYYNTCTFCFDYIPNNWVEIFNENKPE